MQALEHVVLPSSNNRNYFAPPKFSSVELKTSDEYKRVTCCEILRDGRIVTGFIHHSEIFGTRALLEIRAGDGKVLHCIELPRIDLSEFTHVRELPNNRIIVGFTIGSTGHPFNEPVRKFLRVLDLSGMPRTEIIHLFEAHELTHAKMDEKLSEHTHKLYNIHVFKDKIYAEFSTQITCQNVAIERFYLQELSTEPADYLSPGRIIDLPGRILYFISTHSLVCEVPQPSDKFSNNAHDLSPETTLTQKELQELRQAVMIPYRGNVKTTSGNFVYAFVPTEPYPMMTASKLDQSRSLSKHHDQNFYVRTVGTNRDFHIHVSCSLGTTNPVSIRASTKPKLQLKISVAMSRLNEHNNVHLSGNGELVFTMPSLKHPNGWVVKRLAFPKMECATVEALALYVRPSLQKTAYRQPQKTLNGPSAFFGAGRILYFYCEPSGPAALIFAALERCHLFSTSIQIMKNNLLDAMQNAHSQRSLFKKLSQLFDLFMRFDGLSAAPAFKKTVEQSLAVSLHRYNCAKALVALPFKPSITIPQDVTAEAKEKYLNAIKKTIRLAPDPKDSSTVVKLHLARYILDAELSLAKLHWDPREDASTQKIQLAWDLLLEFNHCPTEKIKEAHTSILTAAKQGGIDTIELAYYCDVKLAPLRQFTGAPSMQMGSDSSEGY